jgi:hypothetical protein
LRGRWPPSRYSDERLRLPLTFLVTLLPLNASTTAAAFFMNLVGQIAAVRGTWDGTTLTAQQASLGEGEDD